MKALRMHPVWKRVFGWLDLNAGYAAMLLGVMLLAYGWQMLTPGFYWDDWQAIYLAQFNSPGAFWEFFLNDRPISAWTFILTFPILGVSPLAWQIFTLLVRWSGILALMAAFERVWRGKSWQIRLVGFLLAVFPGFTQQAVSVAYSQHFITFGLFATSILCMVLALRGGGFWRFTLPGMGASLLQMLTMEYFAGLELLRPLLLWIILSETEFQRQNRVRKLSLHWMPYLAMLACMLLYRFVIFPGISPEPDMNYPTLLRSLLTNPAETMIHLAQISLQDGIHTLIFAWLNALQPANLNLQARFVFAAWIIGIGAAGGLVYYSLKTRQGMDRLDDHFHAQAALVGAAGILLGGLPVWLTDRQMIVGMWSDRFSLAPMIGSTLLMVAVVDWIGVDRLRKLLVLSCLVAFGVSYQVQIANRYRINWDIQRAYYWQLSWRVPGIASGTAVISPDVPFGYVADMSLGFAYNVLYNPSPSNQPLPVWFFTAGRLWGLEELPRLQASMPAALPVEFKLRNIQFKGDTRMSLGVQYNASRGCLRVTDDIYAKAPVLTDDPSSQFERFLYSFAGPSAIQLAPTLRQDRLRMIFGPEPAHQWCYYFEKADLARQFQNWEEIVLLADTVQRLGYRPLNAIERLPFIEGFTRRGRWDDAVEWTKSAYDQDSRSQAALCQYWKKLSEDSAVRGSGEMSDAIRRAQLTIQCLP